jgi:murein DD-endopeptidase MepM/ murein hydrolase activator NlpD
MLKRKKYVFDKSNLQFLQHRRKWSEKLLRFLAVFALSVLLTFLYSIIFHHFFGYVKQERLSQQVEAIKLNYDLLERRIDHYSGVVADLRSSDNSSYRAILDLPQIPENISEGGAGGISRLSDLTGYINTGMMTDVRSKFENLKTETNIQYNSFNELSEKAEEWKVMWEHLPYIRPVEIDMPLGDGFKFREHHPVLGSPRWHFGQDFRCPVGTEVFATGAGTVYFAGNDHSDFGNNVIIDHGYGYRTIYGHLSECMVEKGQKVRRGDLIGLSGNTGLSSGPHLHYQIDLVGSHVNPLWYFQDDLTEEEYFRMLDFLSRP